LTLKMGSAGGELRKQLDEISDSFDKALGGIESVGASVEDKSRLASRAAERATHSMEVWGEAMEKGTAKASRAAQQISTEAQEASRAVLKQTEALTNVSNRAREISEALTEQTKVAGTGEFLKRMSLITEALESVAIDLNRVLETRVSEDDWQKFSHGDKSVFLRKILGRRSKSKLGRITKLYREDSEFRDYVTRYLRQFDGLIADAKKTDQEGVLSAGFMTSDAGKVYMLLRAALDWETGGDVEED